jgi:hypothetical protein
LRDLAHFSTLHGVVPHKMGFAPQKSPRPGTGAGRRDFVAVPALIRQSISGMLPPQTKGHAMSQTNSGRRIVWQSVITVLSAAVLISAEVFGAAFAGGWALANLMGFGDIGVYVLQVIFFVGGVAVMIAFVRNGMRVEPFTAPE